MHYKLILAFFKQDIQNIVFLYPSIVPTKCDLQSPQRSLPGYVRPPGSADSPPPRRQGVSLPSCGDGCHVFLSRQQRRLSSPFNPLQNRLRGRLQRTVTPCAAMISRFSSRHGDTSTAGDDLRPRSPTGPAASGSLFPERFSSPSLSKSQGLIFLPLHNRLVGIHQGKTQTAAQFLCHRRLADSHKSYQINACFHLCRSLPKKSRTFSRSSATG